MLFAWDLPLQMCELVKYNDDGPTFDHCLAPERSNITFHKTTLKDHEISDGLALRDNCVTCGSSSKNNHSARKCPTCESLKPPALCLFCEGIIRGLAFPCLSCGHVLHAACRAILEAKQTDLDDSDEDGGYVCVSGCGCRCSEQAAVEIEEQEERPWEDSKTVQTIIDQDRFEQENEGWHDVAYESLARNLDGRHLTPKTSQIWRGSQDDGGTAKGRTKSMVSSLRHEETF